MFSVGTGCDLELAAGDVVLGRVGDQVGGESLDESGSPVVRRANVTKLSNALRS
jgi:hypothetical protein